MPRVARLRGRPLAPHHDGAGLRQGLSRRHPAPLSLLRAVLACARHHLGRGVFCGLSSWECGMSDQHYELHGQADMTPDLAPGDESEGSLGVRVLGYVVGLGLALLLTATSFFVAGTNLVWQPSIPVAIIVLAIAQMFIHIPPGPDTTNNVMALFFGILIVVLVIGGSLWIMDNLNHNMAPMNQIMQ